MLEPRRQPAGSYIFSPAFNRISMMDKRTAPDRARHVLSARRCGYSATGGVFALVLSATAPSAAAGQLSAAVVGHVGRSAAAPGSAMIDVAAEVGQGPLALRAGVGMDAAGTPFAPMLSAAEGSSGVWTADADVGLAMGRLPLLDVLVGRWHPTAFIGLGVAGVSTAAQPDGTDGTSVVPTWSWGGRAGVPLLSWLSIEGEARRRQTLDDVSPADYPVHDEWEYRVGLALRFGGGEPRAATSRAPGPRRGGSVPGRGTRTIETRDERRAASAAEIADNTIALGERYIGTPYVWGGESPDGFDCSGFVQYVYRRQGIDLPRVSRDQAHAGRALPTSLSGIARGDLLFFAGDGRTVSHVGIYAGDGRMLHSSSSGRGVRYDDLRSSRGGWYVNHLVAVRRVIDDDYLPWPDSYAADEFDAALADRALPLDEAFDALVGDRGDEDAPAAN